ncbi:hypothetical protein TSACC_2225 [Terrimicrobium sacchariphilum]|jgi:hypothetical protein|uniref:Uncharacterized protein n=1 Tax=Terrimicrobium sacchariphilum TaxID=690879 RepID=A0A146G2D9_TERSA|nr:hypothetical protein [Terrimicrobium sacchariphilum]GAT31831.1 hypothetical protein TSACC_2225 [Terrimicrobium sacchariphilum]
MNIVRMIIGLVRQLRDILDETWRVQLWLWENYSDSLPGRRPRK